MKPWLTLLLILTLVACAPAATPLPTATPAPTNPAQTATPLPPVDTPTPRPTPAPRTLADLIAADPRLSRFAEALEAAGLSDSLADPARRLTVFAPANTAFAALAPERAARLQQPDVLADVLRHHLTPGAYSEAELALFERVDTEAGEPLAVVTDVDGAPQIGAARVEGASAAAANGVLYVVDAVLWPLAGQTLGEVVAGDWRLSELNRAVQRAGLTDLLSEPGPYTLFAPTNKAFAALGQQEVQLLSDPKVLRSVLLYHMVKGLISEDEAENIEWTNSLLDQPLLCNVDGDLWEVNNSQITVYDLRVANGLLHFVNEVLFPPIDLTLP